MKVIISILSVFAVATAQRLLVPDLRSTEINEPIPYSFNYVAPGEEGQSTHQEVSDGNGHVRGSYSLSDIDGRSRVVEYEADENGFRAVVRTNEPGTTNQNPADVIVESSAPAVAPEPALHAAPIAAPIRPVAPVRRLIARPSGGVRYVLVPVRD